MVIRIQLSILAIRNPHFNRLEMVYFDDRGSIWVFSILWLKVGKSS